jgi:hypothetical protein
MACTAHTDTLRPAPPRVCIRVPAEGSAGAVCGQGAVRRPPWCHCGPLRAVGPGVANARPRPTRQVVGHQTLEISAIALYPPNGSGHILAQREKNDLFPWFCPQAAEAAPSGEERNGRNSSTFSKCRHVAGLLFFRADTFHRPNSKNHGLMNSNPKPWVGWGGSHLIHCERSSQGTSVAGFAASSGPHHSRTRHNFHAAAPHTISRASGARRGRGQRSVRGLEAACRAEGGRGGGDCVG